MNGLVTAYLQSRQRCRRARRNHGVIIAHLGFIILFGHNCTSGFDLQGIIVRYLSVVARMETEKNELGERLGLLTRKARRDALRARGASDS